MVEITERRTWFGTATRAGVRTTDRTFQAYRILHLAFIVAPTIAGLDKFLHWLVNWNQYLAPSFERFLPFSANTFMMMVGGIEMAAGLLVALRPRIGAYVVAGWMGAIIVNLLVSGGYYDVALRDFGLMLGAIALGRLAQVYDQAGVRERPRAVTPITR